MAKWKFTEKNGNPPKITVYYMAEMTFDTKKFDAHFLFTSMGYCLHYFFC